MNSQLLWTNLLTYCVQIGVLVGLAGFVPMVLRLRWAGARLLYWQILLVACVALPMVRPWRREVISAVGMPVSATIATVTSSAPVGRLHIPAVELALWFIAAGVAIRLGWLAVGFWRLRGYRKNAARMGSPAGCPANALLSEEVASPVTFGWRKPVVLLPARFVELEPRIQQAILCHELLHVERRDWLFTLAEELVRAIFWFHPAIWWIVNEIQLAREQTVDCLAIDRTAAREEYVDALLSVAGVAAQMDLSPAPLFLRKRHLKQRMVSIFQEKPVAKTKWISRLAAGVTVVMALGWLVAGAIRLTAAPQVVNDAAGVNVDLGGAALIHRAPVKYPLSAIQKGVQGTVMVDATLDASGNVSDTRVMSGPDELRRAALESVLQWHFADGAAGLHKTVSIAFQLPEGSATGKQAQGIAEMQRLVAQLNSQVDAQFKALQQAQSQSNPPTVERIVVSGLSDQTRNELLDWLGVHEGDAFTVVEQARINASLRSFDEHLRLSTRIASGKVTIVISAPAAVSDATPGANASGVFLTGPNAFNTPVLLSKVNPIYPPQAKEQGIQGSVKFSAIIGADGFVQKLEVVSGHPLLVQAAIDAVKRWQYRPALLNGEPADAKTEITVNFTLSQ